MLHDGSLPGTRALLIRQGNGYSWAVLFNTRNDGGVNPVTALNGGLSIVNAISNVTQWPSNDLFDTDLDRLPDSYEVAHFGSPGETDGTADQDNDGVSDSAEWVAMTNPTDAGSVPGLSIGGAGSGSPVLEIAGRGGRVYSVYSAPEAGTNWDTAAFLTRFNGDGFKRGVPVNSTEPSGFYRTSVAFRAKPPTQGASAVRAQPEEADQIIPWVDLVPRDDP